MVTFLYRVVVLRTLKCANAANCAFHVFRVGLFSLRKLRAPELVLQEFQLRQLLYDC